MMKGRWLVMVLSFLLEVFHVWQASQLELFMSFLSPRLHSFLILFSFHHSTLQSFDTLLDLLPHSLFYASKGLVDNTYLKEYTILKHGLFAQNFVISLYANEKIMFYTCMAQGKGNLQLKTKWMTMNELCLLCATLLEFIMCLASSLIWIHLVTYPNWIESFL